MILSNRLAAAMLAAVMASSLAFAQDDRQGIDFAGGTLSVARDDYERVLAFDGRELHRAYFIGFDRIVTVQDTDVAIFEAGNGGNACGAYPIMVWQREGGDIEAAITGEDCGAPSPAVANDRIYFVPYLRPGEETTMQAWTPDDGFQTAGTIAFAPRRAGDRPPGRSLPQRRHLSGGGSPAWRGTVLGRNGAAGCRRAGCRRGGPSDRPGLRAACVRRGGYLHRRRSAK